MSVPTQNTEPPLGMPPRPAPKNGLGTTSLVMGILSVAGSWIPFAGFGAYATSIIGIVTGAVGRKRAKTGHATNGGAATAGLTLSILGLASVILASVVYTSLLYAVANSGSPSDVSTRPAVTSTVDSSKGTTKEPTKEPTRLATIGHPVRDGKFEFTVVKVANATHVGDSTFGEDAQGRFTIIQLRIRNIGSEAQTLDDTSQYVYDANGRKFSADTEADIALSGLGGDNSVWFNDINPGNTVHGKLAFDMPRHAKAVKIELHDSMFSGGVTVALR